MPEDVLGPEWGQLAGLPAKEALTLVSEYAANLEDKVSGAGGNRGEADEDGDEDGNGKPKGEDVRAALMQKLGKQQREPLATEYISNREAAIEQARNYIINKGHDWDRLSGYVKQAMAKAPATQQTDPKAWVLAWQHVWGMERWAREEEEAQAAAEEDEYEDEGYEDAEVDPWESMTRDESDPEVPPRPSRQVRRSPVNTRGGRRPPPSRDRKPRINDPVERRTKRQFESFLGRGISDEEWIALDEGDVNTAEEYEALQRKLENRRR